MTKAREIAELGQKLTVDASGNLEFAGDLELGDNNKALFGASSDLQIYHDGAASYVMDTGTGNLQLRGDNSVALRSYSTTDNYLVANFNGSVDIYYDNSKKLATTSTGVDITGSISADGLTVDGLAEISAANTRLNLYETDTTDQNTQLQSSNSRLMIKTLSDDGATTTERLRVDHSTGDISFYEDTGTTAKFFWDASNEALGINTTTFPSLKVKLAIQGTAGASGATANIAADEFFIDNNGDTGMTLASANTGTGYYAFADSDVALRGALFYDHSSDDMGFRVASGTAMTIDASRNVGIGTGSPQSKLDVAGTITADNFTNVDLSPIAATISDTAVDIFVYDTRKDSDGGAWRKRTQHTSWYNETLNTATRGSRKEFPAVAVIVVEAYVVNIYDGDDPNLPLWRYFDIRDYDHYQATNTGVAALNGMIVVSNTGNIHRSNIRQFDFIKDRYVGLRSATYENAHYLAEPLTSTDEINSSGLGGGLVANGYANDVAMTVLPNAPIDATTGLPVPTIAVATDGGVSVIKDDGTVVDDTTFSPINVISFGIDDDVFYGRNGYGRVYKWDYSADTSSTATYVTNGTNPPIAGNTNGGIVDFGNDEYWASGGTTDGLNVFAENKLAANITSEFNTGWMNGDIKLATLSDTDATNVTGSELVTNGTFDSDISGWTASDAGCSLSLVSNQLRITNNDATAGGAVTSFSVVSGKVYTFSVGTSSGTVQIYLGDAPNTGTYFGPVISNSTTWTSTVTGTVYFMVKNYSTTNGATIDVDNISVRLAEEDRSVNGNGLQVFGTVTKSAVATGADLVAYSGFSTSNKLIQPYNSDLNIGTGDVSISTWIKASSIGTTQILIMRGDYTTGWRNAYEIVLSSDGTPYFETYSSTGTLARTATSGSAISTGVWHNLVGIRRGSSYEMWVDGVLKNSTTASVYSISSTTAKLAVGITPTQNSAPADNCSLALARISATAPSPEQIKKIYEDEKVLFQEGAQATLYGSSDAVTALAYDDSTNLLHVGTSAGRSVFQGLRRVDNTTTAVGAAISASNGLVADE